MKRKSASQQTLLGTFIKKPAVPGINCVLSGHSTPSAVESAITVVDDDEQKEEAPARPTNNAFVLMFNAQRNNALASRSEVFQLDLRNGDDDTTNSAASAQNLWAWSWVPSSATPSSAWQGEVKIRQPGAPGADKVTTPVRLRTNVASACTESTQAGAANSIGVHTTSTGRAETPDLAVRVSPSILKSCLQKSVRRGLADSAVAIARHMWLCGGLAHAHGVGGSFGGTGEKAAVDQRNELLRRLPIIMLEDIGLLHPALPVLTWLMMACGAGYVPNDSHWRAVRAILTDTCACKYRDVVPRHALSKVPVAPATGSTSAAEQVRAGTSVHAPTSTTGALDQREREDHVDATKPITTVASHALDVLPQGEACLLRCLIARASYGGMKGDMIMLLQAVELYHRRFTGVGKVPKVLAEGSSWMQLLHAVMSVPASTLVSGPSPYVMWPSIPSRGSGTATVESSVTRLTAKLMPVAGVDFHCSNILQEVLKSPDPRARQACSLLGVSGTGPGGPADTVSVQQAADRLGVYMWNRRSGVNYREPLVTDANTAQERAAASAQFFHDRALLSASAAGMPLPSEGPAAVLAPTATEARAYLLIEPLLDPWARSFLSSRMPS